MGDLQGRIALVTGGAQGIGRAIAEELAAAGAVLALADVNEAKLAETVAETEGTGIDATAFTVNVSSQESIEAGAKAIIEKFGKVEIIVNNAGITRDNLMLRDEARRLGSGDEHQSDGRFSADAGAVEPDAEKSLGTDCEYRQRGGPRGQAGQVNYAASKAGLIGFTRRWRAKWRREHHGECGGAGIH